MNMHARLVGATGGRPHLLILLLLMACTDFESRHIASRHGLSSFRVRIDGVASSAIASQTCDLGKVPGSATCPYPFPTEADPAHIAFTIEALNDLGVLMQNYQGMPTLDVRPGRWLGSPPTGLSVQFVNGVAVVSSGNIAKLMFGRGAVRVWVEDCGSGATPGTFATGASDPIWFENPTITDLNRVADDNATSPLSPMPNNGCAIGGDPRFGVEGNHWVGKSHGGSVDAPPAAMGEYVVIEGCSRASFNAGTCKKGPLVVTAMSNDGFYVSDVNPASVAAGFNHMYVFSFGYASDIDVGHMLIEIRGTPVEFTGTTQLGNPLWVSDPTPSAGLDLLPKMCRITASDSDLYKQVVDQYGRNQKNTAPALAMEAWEGAVVCVDSIAPGTTLSNCDTNSSGSVERMGCFICNGTEPGCFAQAQVPPLCDSGKPKVSAPVPPYCRADALEATCLDISSALLDACHLGGASDSSAVSFFMPGSISEYCCERACALDRDCVESNAYTQYGQWVADLRGSYEPWHPGAYRDTRKIALLTRDARPDFDALKFAQEQKEKPIGERKSLRVIGNLRQVVASRPSWLVVARSREDIKSGVLCTDLDEAMPSCLIAP